MTTRTILTRRTLEVDGIVRTYYVHLPPDYEAAESLPLVLAFHGGGGKATMMHRVSKLTATSDVHSFVVVYPDGLEKHWGDQRSMTGFDRKSDLSFISALLDELERDFKVDPQRIYATGISNGGFFSQDLAIAFPERIAAVASVAATVSVPVFNKVTPPQPVPILFMLGDQDPIVPYHGGDIKLGSERRGAAVSAIDSVDYWCRANHCTRIGPVVSVESSLSNDGTYVTKQRFDGDGVRNQVELYTIKGGGHTWPSGWQYLGESFIGKTNRTLNANEIIWSFFKRHHL
jgi:polyhydroxybutyrate depolymerase